MATTQEEAAEATANPSATLKTSASIYFSILALGLLAFEVMRRRCRRAFDSRGVEGNSFWTTTAPDGGNGSGVPFAWMLHVRRVTDDELLDRCGLDTLSFLRFLRMGQKVALLAVVLSGLLLPLYATAPPPPTTRTNIDPLERINMANLREQDHRLWAPTAVAYIITGFTMYLLLNEYEYYVGRRHELLGRAEPPQYSVLVDELPAKLRTRKTLEAYMQRIFPNAPRSVYVAVECSRLEQYVSEREQARNALEHALALREKADGDRPHHREGRSWVRFVLCCQPGSRGRIVDSIDFYHEKLAKLNEKVAREINSIDHTQAQLAHRVEEREAESVAPFVPEASQTGSAAYSIRVGRGSRSFEYDASVRSSRDHGKEDDAEDEDETEGQGKEENQLEREAARKKHPMRVMRRSAFVSFTSLKAAQTAQQTLQASHPIRMAISPAPHVDDVKWENIGLRFRTRALWRLVSATITATVVLFWTIPTAFVASLSTVESLRRTLPFLNKAFDKYPILEELFKQLAPLALVVLRALAPLVFNFLSEREGHPSRTEVRASVFTKLVYFQLIQIFFVTVIVGTVLDSLEEIVDQPKKLIAMLGRSMPQQSTFFISYVIVLTGLSLVLELLRVVPLALSALFRLFAPKLTKREREGTWLGLRSISSTDPFDPTAWLADSFLVMLVTLTFAPIAPLVCYFTGWFFLVAETVYRRQALFVYKPMSFGYGAYWPRLYKFLIVALVVAQLTLIGLLSLKKAPVQVAVVAVLVIVILLYNHYMVQLFPRVAKYLPVTECARLDELRSQCDRSTTFAFLDNVYRQPAMSEKPPIRADYRMFSHGEIRNEELLSPLESSTEDQRLFRLGERV